MQHFDASELRCILCGTRCVLPRMHQEGCIHRVARARCSLFRIHDNGIEYVPTRMCLVQVCNKSSAQMHPIVDALYRQLLDDR